MWREHEEEMLLYRDDSDEEEGERGLMERGHR